MSPKQNPKAGPTGAKRLPTQTTPHPYPARVAGHSSQPGLTRTTSATLKRPPITPAITSSNASRPGIPPSQRGGGWGIGVGPPSLAHRTLTPALYLKNRTVLMHDSSILARNTHLNSLVASSELSLPGSGNTGGRRLSMPLNLGSGASPSPSNVNVNFSSRPLSYTAHKGRKIPSRSLTTSSVSSSRNALLSATASRGRTVRTTPSAMRSRTLLDSFTTAGVRLQSTNKARSAVPVNTSVHINDDGTPSDNFPRGRKKPAQASVRNDLTPSSAPPSRRRRVFVDDDEDEDDADALLGTPPVTRSSIRKHLRSPSSSSSSDVSLAQAAQTPIPPELTSVRMAMGEANWEEYVGLTESFVGGGISELEFGRRASRVFRVEDEGTRDKILRLVLNMVRGWSKE